MFVCPKCHGDLTYLKNKYICCTCRKKYKVFSQIPVFFRGLSGITTKCLYRKINSEFNSYRFSRLIRFMNMGYAKQQIEDIPFIRNQVINKNSFRLLYYLFDNFLLDDKTVVDFGCGRGGTLFYLNNVYKNIRLYGLDLDITGLKNISDQFSVAATNCCSSLPLKNDSIDVGIFIEVLHAIKKKKVLFKNISSVLKSSGLIFIADAMYIKKWVILEKILKNNKITIVREEDVTKNIINSCEEISLNRIKLLGRKRINTMAAPGSKTFDLLKRRKLVYKFLVAKKY